MSGSGASVAIGGRLVLDGEVMPGRIEIAGDRIVDVVPDAAAAAGPYLAPGFVDVHVHGWGGHDAMDGPSALDGMARALLRHGVTSFVPTAVAAPFDRLVAFADGVRRWSDHAPADGAAPLGFNLEGPCISVEKKGVQNEAYIQDPVAVLAGLEPLLEGLRIMTVAPERPGALDLIRRLAEAGVSPSLGHSMATAEEAAAGYAAGGRTTTHLFNAMSGVDNHRPGLAVTALADDGAYVELIADGLHVDRALWPIIARSKPRHRLILVTDGITLAGVGEGVFTLGDLQVEVRDGACRLVSDGRLAGSVIALDGAVRNVVESGIGLVDAVRAATRNPLDLLGVTDRGRLAPGGLADLVELDEDLNVIRVMKSGGWLA
ncbi:MAG TPA: N-acetylglucosamine-6-phosphate deacetylase [Candidatus Limnocylindria bacterium]|nr:N-acetylglucosamine-6-phosphate deacetylase [Candidatus Limnocylindria bacterium]